MKQIKLTNMKPRNTFIVTSELAKAQLEICENLYQEKDGRQKINDYGDKVGMPYTECKGCETDTPTIIDIDYDTCAVCGSQKEKQELYLTEDWVQTDGSTSTLQYGRKLTNSSWEYMEWVNTPWEESAKDINFKLANLHDSNWRKDTIELKDYSKKEIADAISAYGYRIFEEDNWNGNFNSFQIEQDSELFGVEDSVQLACECLFELEL